MRGRRAVMKRNRIIVGAYDALSFVLIAGVLSLAWITPAYAYVDPSVMTYTIQAIAGVVIAVGAVAGIYWRKAKKKVNEKLGLDENRNKEVESDVLEIKEDDVEPQTNVTSSVKEPEE